MSDARRPPAGGGRLVSRSISASISCREITTAGQRFSLGAAAPVQSRNFALCSLITEALLLCGDEAEKISASIFFPAIMRVTAPATTVCFSFLSFCDRGLASQVGWVERSETQRWNSLHSF